MPWFVKRYLLFQKVPKPPPIIEKANWVDTDTTAIPTA
jgi:hypothetical protein